MRAKVPQVRPLQLQLRARSVPARACALLAMSERLACVIADGISQLHGGPAPAPGTGLTPSLLQRCCPHKHVLSHKRARAAMH